MTALSTARPHVLFKPSYTRMATPATSPVAGAGADAPAARPRLSQAAAQAVPVNESRGSSLSNAGLKPQQAPEMRTQMLQHEDSHAMAPG